MKNIYIQCVLLLLAVTGCRDNSVGLENAKIKNTGNDVILSKISRINLKYLSADYIPEQMWVGESRKSSKENEYFSCMIRINEQHVGIDKMLIKFIEEIILGNNGIILVKNDITGGGGWEYSITYYNTDQNRIGAVNVFRSLVDEGGLLFYTGTSINFDYINSPLLTVGK